MIKLSSNNNFKRGVSLIEVIIAIAVIAIVSVMAVSISTYSIKVEERNLRDMEIAFNVQAVIDCFEFADDEESFDSLITNYNLNTQKSAYLITCSCDWNNKIIEIIALDKNGAEIYSISYVKRGVL